MAYSYIIVHLTLFLTAAKRSIGTGGDRHARVIYLLR